MHHSVVSPEGQLLRTTPIDLPEKARRRAAALIDRGHVAGLCPAWRLSHPTASQ